MKEATEEALIRAAEAIKVAGSGMVSMAEAFRALTDTLSRFGDGMGMYTAIVTELTLRGPVVDFVEWWASWPRGKCPGFPDHPLFDDCDAEAEDPSTTGSTRWYSLLWCNSAYFDSEEFGDTPGPKFERHGDLGVLRSSASLKNYGGEIEAFADWIAPYAREGYVASQYESNESWTEVIYCEGKARNVHWVEESEYDQGGFGWQ